MLFLSLLAAQTLPGSVEELLALAATRSATVRPGLHDGTIDRVYVNFGIDRLGNIDQVKQQWNAIGFLRTWWYDPRLAYNATAVGTSEISLRIDQFSLVWQPDLYWEKLEEISGVSASDGYGEVINIYPDGSVWRSQQRKVVLACPINLGHMPFDTQTCHWLMGMYADRADEVTVQWKDGRPGIEGWEVACPSLWLPIAARQEDTTVSYPSGNYSYAESEIDFIRRK